MIIRGNWMTHNGRMKIKYLLVLFVFALFLTGCVSTSVISSGPDTYMVSASGAGFATAGVRETVYRKANKYCEDRGLVMVPVSFKARPGELGRHPPSADLIFRALKPGDPDIDRPILDDADLTISNKKTIRVLSNKETPPSNIADELMKLDTLRKNGVISEGEFEKAKKRLLE
jgi:hypothetical protein